MDIPPYITWCQEIGNIFTWTKSPFSPGEIKEDIGSQLFSAARTFTRSFKPGNSGQLCFLHTFVWIYPVKRDQHLKSFQILSEKNQPDFLYCEANCKIATRLCAI